MLRSCPLSPKYTHLQRAQAHRDVGRRGDCALPRGAVQQAQNQAVREVPCQVAERLPYQLREALNEALHARHREDQYCTPGQK